MVRALACDSRGCEFDSLPSRCQVTTLGKLFTQVPGACLCHQAAKNNLVPVAGQRCPATGKVTAGQELHWSCVTDFSGLSTYGLKAYK